MLVEIFNDFNDLMQINIEQNKTLIDDIIISTGKCLCLYWILHTCQSSLDSGRNKTYPRQINIEQNKIIIDLNLFNTIKNLKPEYDTFPEYQINGYFPQILCIYYYFYRAGPP